VPRGAVFVNSSATSRLRTCP